MSDKIISEMRDKAVGSSWRLIGSGWGNDIERLQASTEYKDKEDLYISIKVKYRRRNDSHFEIVYQKEIQKIVEWEAMELDQYNEKVGDREVFHREKEVVESEEKAKNTVDSYINQAESEIADDEWPEAVINKL